MILAVWLALSHLPGLLDNLSVPEPSAKIHQVQAGHSSSWVEQSIRREMEPSALYGDYEISVPGLDADGVTVHLLYERGPMRAEEAQVIALAVATLAIEGYRNNGADMAKVGIFIRIYTRGADDRLHSHGMAKYQHETGNPVWLSD